MTTSVTVGRALRYAGAPRAASYTNCWDTIHNIRPEPFVWTKSADDILTRERRALDALDGIRGNR